MKRFLRFCAFCLFSFCFNVYSQTSVQYTPLRCVGEIPEDFKSLSYEKTSNDIDKINKQKISRKERKVERKFALNSNFSIDAMLLSGKVLYGDPLSIYVNKVADKILASDTMLRKELRFYVLKSTTVNAYASGQGIVFVTVGLLSKIQNEAELAYILCHEISHFVKKHSLLQYKIAEKVNSGSGQYKGLDIDDKISKIYQYSRSSEMEADQYGLQLFLKTEYAAESAITALEFLKTAALPYDNFEWTKKLIEDDHFQVSSNESSTFSRIDVIDFQIEEQEDDGEEETHPSTDKRIKAIEKTIDRASASGTNKFPNGKSYFDYINQQARIEYFFILINDADFIEAYYLAFIYEKLYNEHAFTSKIKSYCINSLSYKKESKTHYVNIKKKEEVPGLSNYFKSLDTKEFNAIKVRYAWDAYLKNNGDSFNHAVLNYALKQFFKQTKMDHSEFKSTMNSDSNTSKNTSSIEWAFYYNLEHPNFRQLFQNLSESEKNNEEKKLSKKERSRSARKKYGQAAGLDSMIHINPNYLKLIVETNGETKRNLVHDEKKELELSKIFLDMAAANDIHLYSINLMDRPKLSTQTLNEYAQFLEWITEKSHRDEEESMIMFNRQFTDTLVNRAQTSKICISLINNFIYKKEINEELLLGSLFIGPIFPIVLYSQLHRRQDVNLITVIFDLNTGELDHLYNKNLRFNFKKRDYVYAQLYALFNELKTPVR